MTDAEIHRACMEQAELAFKMHDGRRSYEWKVTLGIWAVMLTAMVKHVELPGTIWAAIVLFYGVFWLRPVWVSNDNNKRRYKYFQQLAIDAMSGKPTGEIRPPERHSAREAVFWFGFLSDWAMIFQLAATAMLALIAALYIANNPPPLP